MLFIYFMMFIFSISFLVGVIAFLYDISHFNENKKKTKIIVSADGGEDDDGTDTGSFTADITELE